MRLGQEAAKTKKATKHPTIRDIAWSAGFIEGEGCFTNAVVQATQVQREPVERLLEIFGGSILRHSTSGNWRWQASGSRGRGVMMTLYTLMSPKRKQQILKVLGDKP